MRKLILLSLLLTSCISTAHEHELSILFLGDTSFGENYLDGESENILEIEGYYHSLENFFEILSHAEAVIANLETPFTNRSESPLEDEKDYIHWSGEVEGLDAFIEHNMDTFALANNHLMDYGEAGLEDTLAIMEKWGMTGFGAGLSAEEAAQPYVEVFNTGHESITLAVISGFEYSSTYEDYGFYASEEAGGANLLDPETITQQTQELRATYPNVFVVVFPHWGSNYVDEDEDQQELAHALIEAGANLVIGHGAHKIQGIEEYEGSWIIYSLGNFMFNSPGRYDKLNVDPYSMIASLALDGHEGYQLELYPIVTNNLETNYQSRFVTKEEFNEVLDYFGFDFDTGKDEFGYYIKIPL
jgi:hypothetical protein